MKDTQRDNVKEYYGQTLQTSDDLKTDACCPIDGIPKRLRPYLANIHDEVMQKFYGCGSPIPFELEGKTVLDLGCGTGRDCYVLSQMVGAQGKVIGVDMTDEQLAVANRHVRYHMDHFGYKEPNVSFVKSYIEDLQTAGIADNSIDLVVSNCVINLSANKEAVFKEIFRVLKPGGELFFSDVFASRRIPENLRNDKILLGECLGGALYIEDFRRLLQSVGVMDYRIVSSAVLNLEDDDVKRKAGMIDFYSMTVRSFKIDFEDKCENYGHVAFYKGTIEDSLHEFLLDDHHLFRTGMPVPVCGNTAMMLSETAYQKHFNVVGNFDVHYGIFDCNDDVTISKEVSAACC